MHKNDWSLIFFTLLTQMSAGLVIFMTMLYFGDNLNFQHLESGSKLFAPQLLALIAILLATLISFSHLGFPAHAFNAANNLASSWLSREIFGIGLFGLGVLLLFLHHLLQFKVPLFQNIMLVYSSAAGLFLIFAMARIYMIQTIPPWNTWYTFYGFLMSAVILGAMVLVGFILAKAGSTNTISRFLQINSIFLLMQLLVAFFYKKKLTKLTGTGIENPDFKAGNYHTLYLIRLFLIFISAIFLAYLSLRVNYAAVNFQAVFRFYLFILFLIIAEEIIGRFMFYAGYFRIGV